MKRIVRKGLVVTGLAVGIFGGLAHAESGAPHWSYEGHVGPAHWGELAAEFSTCGTGKNQSPIDISGTVEGELPAITFAYQAKGSQIINNGHTIQVNYDAGSHISVDGRSFELKQFHFHSPSENTMSAKHFPLEGHFVHADANGNLAVISVMYQEGAQNSELEKAWSHMPTKASETSPLAPAVDAAALLPANRDYYRFSGSLTTPPCSEGVIWLVMKEPLAVSKEQIEQFTKVLHHPNNRPVQPVNARIIVQ